MAENEGKTYAEWKALGRQVKWGEKSSERNSKGQATFTEHQLVNEMNLDYIELGVDQSDLY